jgi:hypothetical protein
MLKPYRNKNVATALTVLFVFFFGATVAHAASRPENHRLSYRFQLGDDLDGDRIPETATIRQCGHVYQVSIHFTTGRPKLRLTTYVTEGVAGLSFQTADVNNDSKGDLVIKSVTSPRPIGIWLNEGKARFERVNSWLYGVGRHTGPEYQHPHTSQQEPVGNIFSDPLPHATAAVEYFSLEDSPDLISFQPDQLPFDSASRQVLSRGPPATTRL